MIFFVSALGSIFTIPSAFWIRIFRKRPGNTDQYAIVLSFFPTPHALIVFNVKKSKLPDIVSEESAVRMAISMVVRCS